FARFMNPNDILAEEVQGDHASEEDRSPLGDDHLRRFLDGSPGGVGKDFKPQTNDVLPGRHAAHGSGQDVVEHQGGAGNLGQHATQSLSNHSVDAAADEQRTALDVYPAHGVAEEHD